MASSNRPQVPDSTASTPGAFDPEPPAFHPELTFGSSYRRADALRGSTMRPATDKEVSVWRVSLLNDARHGIPSAADGAATAGEIFLPTVADDSGNFPSYVLRRLIGEGGMGEVWEAHQTALGRSVAVKRLRPTKGVSKSEAENVAFRQEALITARLEHPNIVPIYDFGIDDAGEPQLAMKLVRGRPWHDIIVEAYDEITPAEQLAQNLPILKDVAQAVAFAHSRGIIHRDLKPAQVMVGEFGEVLLADWGLALSYDEDLREHSPGTYHGPLPSPLNASNPAGTPVFMAPEQTRTSAEEIGPWTDVYLLGGILYFLLTRTYPHQAATRDVAMALASKGDVEPPHHRAPDLPIPSELAALVHDSMRPDPSQRIASAVEFLRRLDDYLLGSSRRVESEEISREVRARLDELDATTGVARYRLCADLLQRTGRALQLWPDNADAQSCDQTILIAHARAAIDASDYTLARLQVSRLPESDRSAELVRQIDRGEHRDRIQRLYVRASAAVIAIFVALLGWFAIEMRQQRDQLDIALEDAEHQRQIAQQANGDLQQQLILGEELITFMLGDLNDKLRPERRLAVMEAVAKKALEYYEEQPVENTRDEALLHRASAMIDVGEVLRDGDADHARAIEIFEEAAQMAHAVSGRTDDPRMLREALAIEASAYENLAATWRRRGDLDMTTSSSMKMDEIGTRLVELGRVRSGNLWRSLAKSALAETANSLGKTDEVIALLEEGIAYRRRAAEPNGEKFEYEREASIGLLLMITRLADAHLSRGEFTRVWELMDEGSALTDKIDIESTTSPGEMEVLMTYYDRVGSAAFEDSKRERAMEAFGMAELLARRLAQHDPDNLDWQRQLASIISRIGLVESFESTERARAKFLPAIDLLTGLVERSPDDLDALHELAIMYQFLANTYHYEGRHDEAVATIEKAIDMTQGLVERDPTNLFWMEGLSHSWRILAEMEHARDDAESALRVIRGMIDAHRRLVELDPSNVRYKAELSRGYNQLYSVMLEREDWEGALGALENMVEIRLRSKEVHPDYPGNEFWIKQAYTSSGRVQLWRGILEEAQQFFDKADAVEVPIYSDNQKAFVYEMNGDLEQWKAELMRLQGRPLAECVAQMRVGVDMLRISREGVESGHRARRQIGGLRTAAFWAIRDGDLQLAQELADEARALLASMPEETQAEPDSRLELLLIDVLDLWIEQKTAEADGASDQLSRIIEQQSALLADIRALVDELYDGEETPDYHHALNVTLAHLYWQAGLRATALRGLLRANTRQIVPPSEIELYRERLRADGIDVEALEAEILVPEWRDELDALDAANAEDEVLESGNHPDDGPPDSGSDAPAEEE